MPNCSIKPLFDITNSAHLTELGLIVAKTLKRDIDNFNKADDKGSIPTFVELLKDNLNNSRIFGYEAHLTDGEVTLGDDSNIYGRYSAKDYISSVVSIINTIKGKLLLSKTKRIAASLSVDYINRLKGVLEDNFSELYSDYIEQRDHSSDPQPNLLDTIELKSIELYSTKIRDIQEEFYGTLNNIVNSSRQNDFKKDIFNHLIIDRERNKKITSDIQLNIAISRYKQTLFDNIYSYSKNALGTAIGSKNMYSHNGEISDSYYEGLYAFLGKISKLKENGELEDTIRKSFTGNNKSFINALNSYVNLRYFDSLLHEAIGEIVDINRPYRRDDEDMFTTDTLKYKFGQDTSNQLSGFEKENGRHALSDTAKLSKLIVEQTPLKFNGVNTTVSMVQFARAFSSLYNLSFKTSANEQLDNFYKSIRNWHNNPSVYIPETLKQLNDYKNTLILQKDLTKLDVEVLNSIYHNILSVNNKSSLINLDDQGKYSLSDCILGTIDRIHSANFFSTTITANGIESGVKAQRVSRNDEFTLRNNINNTLISRTDRIGLDNTYTPVYSVITDNATNKVIKTLKIFYNKQETPMFTLTFNQGSAITSSNYDNCTLTYDNNADPITIEDILSQRYTILNSHIGTPISKILTFIDKELGTSFKSQQGFDILQTYQQQFGVKDVLKNMTAAAMQAAHINKIYIDYNAAREKDNNLSMKQFLQNNTVYAGIINEGKKLNQFFTINAGLYDINVVNTSTPWTDDIVLAKAILNGDSSKATTSDLSGNKLGNYRTASLGGNIANYIEGYKENEDNHNKTLPATEKVTFATTQSLFAKFPKLLIREVLDTDVKSFKGEIRPVKKMSPPELFYHAIIDKFFGSYISDRTFTIQPTTMSDKTALPNYSISGDVKFELGNKALSSMTKQEIIQTYYDTVLSGSRACLNNTLQLYNKLFELTPANDTKLNDKQVLDASSKALTEQQLIKLNCKQVLDALSKVPTEQQLIRMAANKGIEIVQDLHYRNIKGKLTLNETMLNDALMTVPELTTKFEQQEVQFLKALLNSGVSFDYSVDYGMMQTPVQQAAKLFLTGDEIHNWTIQGQNQSTLILAKVRNSTKNINIFPGQEIQLLPTDEVILNPLLRKYFYLDNLLSANLRMPLTGYNYSHPDKSRVGNIDTLCSRLLDGDINAQSDIQHIDNIASSTQFKRNVIIPATLNYVTQGNPKGVLPRVKVAFIEDLRSEVFGPQGEVKSNLEANDGSSFTTVEQAILENNSLQDQAVGLDKKTIWHHMYDEFGCSALMKHASYALSNARMNASSLSSVSLYRMYKKMTNFAWDKKVVLPKDFASIIGLDSLQYKEGNTVYQIDGLQSARFNKQWIYYTREYDIAKHIRYYVLQTFDNATSEIRKFRLINTRNNKVEDILSSLDEATQTKITNMLANNHTINSNFELWQTLGGLSSGKLEDNKFIENDDSHYALTGYMNSTFQENTNYQPLKHSTIAYLTNKSAIKNGIANLNMKTSWNDDSPLTYFHMDTKGLGVQMDAEHEVADSELTEMTQVLSALAANGYYQKNVEGIFNGLSNIIDNTAGQEITAVSNYLSKTSGEPESVLKNKLYDVIGRLLIDNIKANPNNLDLSETIINKIKDNFHINKGSHDIDILKIPFSDPNIYNTLLPAVIGVMNAKAVRRKYPGSGFVMVPSYGFIQTFKIGGQSYLFPDLYREASDFVKQVKASALTGKPLSSYINNPKYSKFKEDSITEYPEDLNENQSDREYQQSLVKWYLNLHQNKEIASENRYWMKPADAADVLVDNVPYSVSLDKISDYYLYKFGTKDQILKDLRLKFNIPDLNGNLTFRKNVTLPRTLQPSLISYELDGHESNIFDIPEIKKAILSGRTLDKDIMQNILNHIAKGIVRTKPITNIHYTAAEAIMSNIFANTFSSQHMSLRELLDNGTRNLEPQVLISPLSELNNHYDLAYLKSDGNHTFVTFNEIQMSPKMKLSKLGSYEINDDYIISKNSQNRDLYTYGYLEPVYDVTYDQNNQKFLDNNQKELSKSDYIYDINSNIVKKIMPFVDTYTLRKGKQFYTIYAINKSNLKAAQVTDEFTGKLLSDLYNIGSKSRQRQGSYFGLSSMQKNDNYPRLIEILKYSDFYGTANTYKERLINADENTNIAELLMAEKQQIAKERHTSLLSSLDIVASRIPAQSLQSFMQMKVVGYSQSEDNKVYVSPWQTWLQGSDYDIDKAYIMCSAFDGAGKYKSWSNLFDFSTLDTLRASQTLPIPNNGRSFFADPEGLELANIEKYTSGTRADQIKYVANMLKSMSLTSRIGLANAPEELINDLNRHEATKLPVMDEEDIYKNTVSSGIMQISSGIQNFALSNSPISVDNIGDAAKSSPIGNQTATLSMLNPLTKYIMQYQNLVGKDVIGIAAVGVKAYYTLLYYYQHKFNTGDLQYTNFVKSYSRIQNRAIDTENTIENVAESTNKSKLANINYDTIPDDVFKQLFGDNITKKDLRENEYADLKISEILSAATDNAKELILAKINCNSDYAGMYLHLVMMGFNLIDIVKFMTCPVALTISKLSSSNIFDFYKTKLTTDEIVQILHSNLEDKGKNEFKINSIYPNPKFFNVKLNSMIDNIKQQYYNIEIQQYNRNFVDDIPMKLNPESGDTSTIKEVLNGGKFTILTKDQYDELDAKSKNSYDLANTYFKTNAIKELLADADEFQSVSKDAEEISNLGNTFLGLNQGLPTDKISLDKRLDSITRAVTSVEQFDLGIKSSDNVNAIKNKIEKGRDKILSDAQINDLKEAKANDIVGNFNVHKWLSDQAYKDLTIKYYDLIKRTHNIFDVVNTVPQYKKYLDLLKTEAGIDTYSSVKSVLLDITKDAIKSDWASRKYYKSMTPDQSTKLIDYVNKLLIRSWLRNGGNTFIVNTSKDDIIFNNTGDRTKVVTPGTLNLGSDTGVNSFKLWFESSIFPKLKSGNFQGKLLSDNKLIQHLVYSRDNDLPVIKLDFNLTNMENNNYVAQETQGMLYALHDLETIPLGKWSRVDANNKPLVSDISVADALMLYNLVVNENKSGINRLTAIFKQYYGVGNNIMTDFYTYLGNQDFNIHNETIDLNKLGFNMDDVNLLLAPKVENIDNIKIPFAKVWNQDTKQYDFYKNGRLLSPEDIFNNNSLNRTQLQDMERLRDYNDYCIFKSPFRSLEENKLDLLASLGRVDENGNPLYSDNDITEAIKSLIQDGQLKVYKQCD